jgi:oxalate decarboxylase
MGKLLRRNVLTNAAVAGAMLGTASATMAQTSGDIPQPSRSPGVGGTDPHAGDVVRERRLDPPGDCT